MALAPRWPRGSRPSRKCRARTRETATWQSSASLSTLNFLPCRGCAHLCARSNICPVEDDLRPFLEPILEADALVLASPINAGTITAWMYSFLSRIWCFHHLKNLLEGKPLVLVVTALFRRSERDGVRRFDEAIRRWGHNMRHLGAIFHATDIPPCFKCGVGTRCKVGGLWGMVGRDEEKLHSFKITRDKFKRWEDCPQTAGEVER
ncbi:MAG: flavodoxin family protein, partial [Planctomycetota bacterium]